MLGASGTAFAALSLCDKCFFTCCWLGPVKIRRSDEVEDASVYSDTELRGFDEHKPVILHLLSQLKLGMDLTKVLLLVYIFGMLAYS